MLSAAQIRRYIAFIREQGFDACEVLADTGLCEADLLEPTLTVTQAQCETIIERVLTQTGNTAVGFELGVTASIADLGIISHALMTSPHLRQVIELWCRYGASLAGMPLRLQLEEAPNAWTMRVIDEWQLRPSARACCVEQLLAMGVRLGAQLAGQPLTVHAVQMSHARPSAAEVARHTAFFGCAVTYGARHSAITLAASSLDAPREYNDAILHEICVRHCQRVLRQSGHGSPLLSHLRSLFLREPNALPTMEAAAMSIGASTRTLRRHLKQGGTTYQQLLNRFRYELACEYLINGHMSAKEVGFALGFQFTNTFHRAFRAWSGMTVGAFVQSRRQNNLAPQAIANVAAARG
jgi:AraC-like DNA-binding protein